MTHSGGITAESGFLLARGILMPTRKTTSCRVTIIIPHYNQKECLKTLLPSVANQTFKDYEAIMIDDCTPDRSAVEYIKDFAKDHDSIRLVENTENMRFVKTVNKGIKLATGDYICLLNSDTEVKDNFIQRNVEILDSDASIAGLSCIITDQHGKNWFSGGRYKLGVPINLRDDFQGLRSADFVAGTAAFYRREVFDKVGLFDEHYIMYHEDVEFGLRIRAKTDYRLCVFSDKLVTHYLVPSIPSSDLSYYLNRNLVLLARAYDPKSLPILALRLLLYRVARHLVHAAGALILLRPSVSRRVLRFALSGTKGTIDGLSARQDV
jgi:GT2 family glycosyltransferase